MKEVCYLGEAIENLITKPVQFFQHHGQQETIPGIDDWHLKVMIGIDSFWNFEKLMPHAQLQPDQEVDILNEFFLVVNDPSIDEVIFSVTYRQGDETYTQKTCLLVIEYKTQNDYTFPVKGVWEVVGNYV